MNLLWRTILHSWLSARRSKVGPFDVVSTPFRVLPTDLDIYRHMNNGRYLSLFDLGRWDLLVRTGLWDVMQRRGWYAVVSSETVTFRKSLNLWQRFDVESRLIGHDDKAIYLEHRAVVEGEVYARAIIRARMLKRSGGTLSHEELFAAVGRPEGIPEVDEWVHDWAAASALPPTRADAPSIWN